MTVLLPFPMSTCTRDASRSLTNREGLRWSTLLFLVGSSGSPHLPSGSRNQCQQLPLGISTRGTPPGFSRATGHVGGGLQQPMGNQETRLVVRLVRTSHCRHPAREGRPPRFWTRVHIPPVFCDAGTSACFPRKLAGQLLVGLVSQRTVPGRRWRQGIVVSKKHKKRKTAADSK